MKLRIKVLTWNLGDNHLTEEQWLDEVKKSWSIIGRRDFDVLGLCIQEDSRGRYGKFGDAVGKFLGSDFTTVSHSVEGPPEVTKLSFSVRAFLFLKKSIFVNYNVRKNDVCLKRTVFCSKGTAGVSVITPIDGKVMQLILMSSHLPVDVNKDDLGYAERVQSVATTFKEVYDKLADVTITQRVAFWAGDLNFRNNTPINPGGNPMKDQLDYTFSVRPASFFREFAEPDVEFPPTCKMASCNKLQCPACRNNSGNIFNPTCYINEVPKIPREPSHCDRILYRSDNIDGEVVEYKSWGGANSVQHSDHNVVYATYEITV